ncbi:Schwann cell myelin protein isoform X3 [Pseudochaenichthys georgianus]|uniref:Schwann cell myelin protein isoform X3 n=1 Tax=Pseudochaenichthys georgianus TaxID=52239 RepID=UPI00146C3811|nr:B-cell receptor CD22-like isoform X3 [Pseudochaenichthys georgianus]
MASFTWTLFFVGLCLKVTQTEASSWTIKMPSSIKGLPGSCVVIPCSFSYPDPGKKVTEFIGIWIEMTDYEKFSYHGNAVSITMISELNTIGFSMKEEVTEGQSVSASCSVSHSCPTSPPVFTWSHSGEEHVQPQQLEDGQWSATSTLTFQPTSADHNKPVQCTVTYKGGQHHKTSRTLKVKHAPVNVKVEHKSEVKEGEAVQLRCSSDAYPPATSYQWHNETGSQLHRGHDYRLLKVSRHAAALYCTAINTIGSGKSNAVQLNVLYAPEIAEASSCTSEGDMVKCVCISDSKPPSMLYFVLPDRVLPSTKVEKHGSVTIGTLHAELGSSVAVCCLANNTIGNANLTLSLPVNSKMLNLYIIIASVAGGILVMIFIMVKVGKKCRGKSEDARELHLSSVKADDDVAHPVYAATKRKERCYDDVNCSNAYDNDHLYGNMENDLDDAIYANM